MDSKDLFKSRPVPTIKQAYIERPRVVTKPGKTKVIRLKPLPAYDLDN